MKTYTTPAGTLYKLYLDALAQPHLLIAGATGSGKSVIINGLIYTALHRLPLDREHGAQFILIDPKRVELVQYSRLPHTIKYASEPAPILDALRMAMAITEDRYKRMQARRLRKYPGGDVYVIIDEFADLMTTDARTVKPIVQRLAQIGRAARVHIILATQTPISKVLPTEIKCNFDARFGLRTRSAQDSRNILDRPGLELLPRYGQAIYRTPAGDTLYNVPYYSDAELQRIVDHWEAQQAGPLRRFLARLTAGKKYDTIRQTIKMEGLHMANIRVYEDNGGNINLFVLDNDGAAVAGFANWEYTPGSVREAAQQLRSDPDAWRDWGGEYGVDVDMPQRVTGYDDNGATGAEPMTINELFLEIDASAELIAWTDGGDMKTADPARMGAAGRKVLAITDND